MARSTLLLVITSIFSFSFFQKFSGILCPYMSSIHCVLCLLVSNVIDFRWEICFVSLFFANSASFFIVYHG